MGLHKEQDLVQHMNNVRVKAAVDKRSDSLNESCQGHHMIDRVMQVVQEFGIVNICMLLDRAIHVDWEL